MRTSSKAIVTGVAALAFLAAGTAASNAQLSIGNLAYVKHIAECMGWLITDPDKHAAECLPSNVPPQNGPLSTNVGGGGAVYDCLEIEADSVADGSYPQNGCYYPDDTGDSTDDGGGG